MHITGWCTWDSFYTDLTPDGVLGGLASFRGVGVTPRFLILDDGWQSTTVDDKANTFQWGGKLTGFDANFKFDDSYDGFPAQTPSQSQQKQQQQQQPEHYKQQKPPPPQQQQQQEEESMGIKPVHSPVIPAGTLPGSVGRDPTSRHTLAGLISTIKRQYDVKYMLVWPTLTGYWAGVEVEVGVEVGVGVPVIDSDTCSGSGSGNSRNGSGSSGSCGSSSDGIGSGSGSGSGSGVSDADAPPHATSPVLNPGLSLVPSPSPLAKYSPEVAYPDLTASLQRMSLANALDGG